MKTENVENAETDRSITLHAGALGETGTDGQANTEPSSEDTLKRGMLDDWMRGDDSDNPAGASAAHGSTVETSTEKKANRVVAGEEPESDNVLRD